MLLLHIRIIIMQASTAWPYKFKGNSSCCFSCGSSSLSLSLSKCIKKRERNRKEERTCYKGNGQLCT